MTLEQAVALLAEAREYIRDLKDPYRRCSCPECKPSLVDTLPSRIDNALAAHKNEKGHTNE